MFNGITIMSDYAHQKICSCLYQGAGSNVATMKRRTNERMKRAMPFLISVGGSGKNRHGEKNQASMDPQLAGYVKALNGVLSNV